MSYKIIIRVQETPLFCLPFLVNDTKKSIRTISNSHNYVKD